MYIEKLRNFYDYSFSSILFFSLSPYTLTFNGLLWHHESKKELDKLEGGMYALIGALMCAFFTLIPVLPILTVGTMSLALIAGILTLGSALVTYPIAIALDFIKKYPIEFNKEDEKILLKAIFLGSLIIGITVGISVFFPAISFAPIQLLIALKQFFLPAVEVARAYFSILAKGTSLFVATLATTMAVLGISAAIKKIYEFIHPDDTVIPIHTSAVQPLSTTENRPSVYSAPTTFFSHTEQTPGQRLDPSPTQELEMPRQ